MQKYIASISNGLVLPLKYDDYAESGFLITAKGNSE